MAHKSVLEEEMLLQIRDSALPEPVREHKFHTTRRWRLDFYWESPIVDRYDLALEVEGGTWIRGRHVTGQGIEKDIEKYNEALMHNILVLRATSKHVKDGRALEWVKRAIKSWTTVSPRDTRQ
jgi:hypothetical protein